MQSLLLIIVLAPLAAAILAGLFGRTIGRVGAHSVTIAGVATAFAGSALLPRARRASTTRSIPGS